MNEYNFGEWQNGHWHNGGTLVRNPSLPAGPWDSEPDYLSVELSGGLIGLVLRMDWSGTVNGYVMVPVDHPLYGAEYSDPRLDGIEVHGGLTFSGEVVGVTGSWGFGFDTAHYGDVVPAFLLMPHRLNDGIYRGIGYVVTQVLSLGEQINAQFPPAPPTLEQPTGKRKLDV